MLNLSILIILLISNCSCAYVIKLEINSSYVTNNLYDYYYFEPKEGNDFIQIKFQTYLADFFMYNRFYDHDNLTKIMESLPSSLNKNNTIYYFDDTHIYAFAYYKINPNVKTISNYLLIMFFIHQI